MIILQHTRYLHNPPVLHDSLMSDYKLQHELFVSNNAGTTYSSLLIQLLIVPTCILLNTQLQHIINTGNILIRFAVDCITIPYVLLFYYTILSDYNLQCMVILWVVCAILHRWMVSQHTINHTEVPIPPDQSTQLHYLTLYKSTWMLSTCIAILSIDFPIMLRTYGKTEYYGYSMMDIGVGGFIYSTALTSITARNIVSQYTNRAAATVIPHHIYNTCKSLLPVIVLGLMRLVTLKSVDYQEHVSEYGVHWNFFFTIFVVSLLGSILQPILYNQLQYMWCSIAVICIYQYVLNTTDLAQYILYGARTNLFHANKEGIFSTIGYLAIYLSGVSVGIMLLQCRLNKLYNTSIKYKLYMFTRLSILSIILHVLTLFSESYIQLPSRRMVNMTYALYAVAYSTLLIALCLLCEIYQQQYCNHTTSSNNNKPHGTTVPILLQSINHNLLFVFMIANLFTGVINLSMHTIYTPDMIALLVNIIYITLVCGIAELLYYHHIKLKL